MKNVGIHVLDFNDNIIDFISQSDGALLNVEMSMNVEEKTETFDFTIENTRAEKLRERNRIIAQDNNGTFREFIIIHITDNFDGTTEIECNASYLEDLKTAKPIKPGKFEAHTTTQALLKTLADTGWEVSDDTEYGGNRTTSWTSHTNPFDLIYMLCTTYDMIPDFYIELSAHSVEHRYVSITKPKNLFKGKEITKGKDLTGMTRTIDLSEVKTALLAVGPEKEDGSRIETVVVDDEAQEIFGLPNRYIWDVYEPETEDENMTLKRLTTLAKTELNKRNQAAISYEVSSIDIHKYYNDVTVHLRDIVRVKDRDFRPPLYIEAEVIGIKYNWLADESEFTFGNVIEYEETKLREFFTRKLDEITKKLNDNISNVNTIVSDVVDGELEYYERKIFKGAEPPENPQSDTLWYDTSNSDVAVLRRYWDGEWITQTADDVEKIGGLRREQVMYRDLNNSFINLTIQHSKLQNDVYDVLNNEYLVDDDLKANLNQALSDVDNVYQNIKTNLDSMDEDTATIGKLVDTQTLFTVYREKLQTLYKYVTDAKISIDKRLKLLQSQYTDEKFNDAMDKIAQTLPNGRWDSENQQLYADIPNRNEVENLKTTLQEYTDGQISNLNSVLGKEIDSKINTTKNEISASISSVERKVDGLNVSGRNLLLGTLNYDYGFDNKLDSRLEKIGDRLWVKVYNDWLVRQTINTIPNETYTISFKVKPIADNTENSIYTPVKEIDTNNNEKYISYQSFDFNKEETFSFNVTTTTEKIRITFLVMNSTYPSFYITDMKVEKGTMATDWSPAPEDIERAISKASEETQALAKSYTESALKPITTRIIANETNISELDDQISLMAKSDDVAQKLRDVDGRLTPLETDVKNNKATLDILPTRIDSKVSKQDYTLDKNDIVQRLDNVDSERKQLSNEITDKVTLTQFESGISDAKNYTDAYKRSNDVAMTKLETSISQNGDKIALKVDEQKFNASRKTLSQVISEISATTKGINLSYDENGNIQSYTMDKNGIQLRGDKVDITVNKDFNVMASKVDDKVGKNEIINRLNLSPEGLDINVNNIGIRGGDSVDYIDIRNNSILSYGSFTRTWANETDTANLRLGIQGGTVKVQNRTTGYNLYLTEKGLSTMLAGAGDETAGTLEFHSTKYNDTSRGVRLHSTYGAVTLESDYSRIILNANLTVNIESNYGIYFRPYRDNRTGNNEFAMYVKQNDSGAYTDGVLKYGNVSSDTSQYGSGLRFSKSSINSTIYATNKNGDIGTGDFYANRLWGDWSAKDTNLYALVAPKGELRVTDGAAYNDGNPNYQGIAANEIRAGSLKTLSGNFYIGVSTNELRVTNNLLYNGGNIGYKDIRFANWHAMSSEKFKYDIKEWNYSVLDAFRNDLKLYSYKLNSEKETNYARNHHGIIIEREIPIEWRHGDGFDGNEVMFWNTKAIQELIEKVDKLEEQLNEQSITS
ncbi:phage tail spike protein [Staphylococcus hominis]|uniref:phage tail spike protein n=1 Tax=Staphylococcus hominis TaxID=1290 RepID=UPI00076520AC|nr:phage tail spike protein [Staphylococcus hominis]CVY56141.1 phage minor structural protein%2C N-terminal region [Staphylococcus hominis]